MAGKRQHIIPKFLQKGFASKIHKKQVFTWVYRKNSEPFEANINNINLEGYFYGKEGGLNADEMITEQEMNIYSPLINKLREDDINFIKSGSEIAELVAHFSIRTKFVRKGFENISEKMFKGFKDILTDETVIKNTLLNPPKHAIEKEVENVLIDTNLREQLEPALEILSMFGVDEENLGSFLSEATNEYLNDESEKEENKELIKEVMSDAFEKSIETIPDSIKEGHIKSLSREDVNKKRVANLEQLNWGILESDSSIILGDSACIYIAVDELVFRPHCDIDKVSQVYLPISSDKMLFGTLNEKPETNIGILNKAIAECSYEQFICQELDDDKRELMEVIGDNSYIASDEEIEKEISEIRSNLENLHEE